MKILKKGIKPVYKNPIHFTCEFCSCHFLAESDEYTRERCELEGTDYYIEKGLEIYRFKEYYVAKCPCCESAVMTIEYRDYVPE